MDNPISFNDQKYIDMLKNNISFLNSDYNIKKIINNAELKKMLKELVDLIEYKDNEEVIINDQNEEDVEPVEEDKKDVEPVEENEEDVEPVEEDVEPVEKADKPTMADIDGGSRRVRFFNMFKKLTRRFKSKKSRGKRRMNKSKKCSKKKSKRRR